MDDLVKRIEKEIIGQDGAWYENLDHRDWLFDGYPIQGEVGLARWAALDWSQAYVDLGPSVAGNLGPYWHVPLRSDEETVHRLYPKLLQSKWARIFRQAALECRDIREAASRLQHKPDEADVERVWQPIETAPKDGSAVLLFMGNHRRAITKQVVAYYADGAWRMSRRYDILTGECVGYGREVERAPTHWQPLPAPPRAAIAAMQEG